MRDTSMWTRTYKCHKASKTQIAADAMTVTADINSSDSNDGMQSSTHQESTWNFKSYPVVLTVTTTWERTVDLRNAVYQIDETHIQWLFTAAKEPPHEGAALTEIPFSDGYYNVRYWQSPSNEQPFC